MCPMFLMWFKNYLIVSERYGIGFHQHCSFRIGEDVLSRRSACKTLMTLIKTFQLGLHPPHPFLQFF